MKWVSAMVLAAALGACEGRKQTEGTPAKRRFGKSVAVFDLSRGAPENPEHGWLSPPRASFDGLLTALSHAKEDENVRGVFVHLGEGELGLARAEELAAVLRDFWHEKAAPKPVVCHAHGYNNVSYMLAAKGCETVLVSPSGELLLVGLAAQVVYLKKLLSEHLGVTVDLLQVGKFKGAEEPFTRDGPSDEARASLQGTLADLRQVWLSHVKDGRGARAGDADLEDGPYTPTQAKERGLVDDIVYADEAVKQFEARVLAVRTETYFDASHARGDELADLIRVLSGGGLGSAPVALVRATGSISMGGSGPFGGGRGIEEAALARLLAKAETADAIKAVVVRIDSPGGSALASDLLWHALMRVRKAKPLVVSVGEMAASGGYYLASAADVVVAEPGSILGSIGVVGGKFGVGGALERIGVHAETFPAKPGDPAAAARAGYLSPLVPWDNATRARVLGVMEGIYSLFLSRIAEGRKLPLEVVARSAEGRIFSGREAKERGLVDELGGLVRAISIAKERASLPSEARVAVLSAGEGIFSEGPGEAARSPLRAALERETHSVPEALKVYAAALWPLSQGEGAVLAIPFGIGLR